MLITPTLIPANMDLTELANDLRKKMQYLQEEFPVRKQSGTSALPKPDEVPRK